ncbi:hypothetical protein [Kordia sp.]|uniref:hypothetical protein n=1 Tax=Kordia sp. TaxID=1965332 RepID=UPI003B5A5E11
MKKRNLKSFKLRKELVSTLTEKTLMGGADEGNALPQDDQVLKSKKWWKCPKHCTAYCG